MLRSENGRLSGWVYVDVRGRDLASTVRDLQQRVAERVRLDAGMTVSYSGQFEFLERANARLSWVVPATLPFALSGGIWLLYWFGFNLSVATGVGFIALAGVSAEFGVIMLLYLKNAWQARLDAGRGDPAALLEAIREGAVLRVRPKVMTVAVIIAGLLPILWGGGAGSEVMKRIAAPMVGGMITAPLMSMLVLPAAYWLMRRKRPGK